MTRSNFERFFTPQLARADRASRPNRFASAATSAQVAVLFTDIRGFTALSETMKPDDMATLLTEYLTEMVECVFRHDGTLDKFIGDSVMAQWGAPLGGPDDADKAMAAAIDMMHELEQLNARWRAAGASDSCSTASDSNFGEAFAGNIGSERRLEFTVIGDTSTRPRVCAPRRTARSCSPTSFDAGADQAAARRVSTDGVQEQEPTGDQVYRVVEPNCPTLDRGHVAAHPPSEMKPPRGTPTAGAKRRRGHD